MKNKKKLKLKKETVIHTTPFNLVKGGIVPPIKITKGCPKSYPQNFCDNV